MQYYSQFGIDQRCFQIILQAGLTLRLLNCSCLLLLNLPVSYFVFRRLAITKKPKDWGVIKDASGAAVANAIVRVFDTQYNKLLETQITGNDGRYSFLVGSNQYYVMAEKPGYQTVTTEPITINAPEGGASLAKDVTLQMQGA